MTPKEKRETLSFLSAVANCASRAADTSGKHREYAELRQVIAENEREHRAFGRRLVGNIGARMTVEQACDYFVAKTLHRGATEYKCGKAPIALLEGTRLDFIMAALLMANSHFARAFFDQLQVTFGEPSDNVFERIEAADYAAMVEKGDGK
jgi:hypothetical protein